MQKRVFGHKRIAKYQISLCVRAVWSGHRYPLTESFDTIECMIGEQMPGWDFVHACINLNLCIFCMLRDIFSFDMAQSEDGGNQ